MCVCVCVCVFCFVTLRTLIIFLPFSVRYGNKCFFAIVQKSCDSEVQFTFVFYLCMFKLEIL